MAGTAGKSVSGKAATSRRTGTVRKSARKAQPLAQNWRSRWARWPQQAASLAETSGTAAIARLDDWREQRLDGVRQSLRTARTLISRKPLALCAASAAMGAIVSAVGAALLTSGRKSR